MPKKGQRILITGGAGFQGKHLTSHFIKQGHIVSILNTPSDLSLKNIAEIKNVRTIWGSVTDPELVDKAIRDQDCVFHLAARIHVDESIAIPRTYCEVNLMGTLNVLQACTKYKKRLICASSCEVYGAPTTNKPLRETAELRPFSPYAASKAAADRLCFSFFKTYGTDVTIVRPFNVFGPYQKEGPTGAVIPTFIGQALKNQPLTVTGSGSQQRDYMYIEDLVRAYDLVFRHPELRGEAINFGSGQPIKIIDIAKFIAKKFKVSITFLPNRPGQVQIFIADITRAKKLGFRPKVNIWQGLEKYINWRIDESKRK